MTHSPHNLRRLKENKWKEFQAKNTLLGAPLSRLLPT